ncbi:MAG: AI-2E family transporter [Myxococcales bacterium]|nr:AI-2E family transporter [Myxococcales bacterium]
MPPAVQKDRLVLLAATSVTLFVVISTMYLARGVLVPFTVAIIVWYLINALADVYEGRIVPRGRRWATLTLAFVTVVMLVAVMVELVGSSVSSVAETAPVYQENLERFLQGLLERFGVKSPPQLGRVLEVVAIEDVMTGLASEAPVVLGQVGIVIIYVLFLLLEQNVFPKKFRSLVRDPERRERLGQILSQVQHEIRTYVWIKTLVSLLTGALAYAVLRFFGVHLAEFWALLIFFLNYIPTIGPLIGLIFPTVLAIVQFGELWPATAIAAGLGTVNFVIGNVIEPRWMGNSLNLSPLVILLSVAFSGLLWGIVGAFVSVPIVKIIAILCSGFEQTRPIAILLSSEGQIREPAQGA